MPLKISLKPHEKVFIGGAVVVNGDARTEFTVMNDVAILREKDILTEADADTPCKRIYLAIQLMYMDERHLPDYEHHFRDLARDVMAAAPSTEPLVSEVAQLVSQNRLYPALKAAKSLVAYEHELISHVHQTD